MDFFHALWSLSSASMVTDLAEGGVVVAGVGVRLLLPAGVARGLPGTLPPVQPRHTSH